MLEIACTSKDSKENLILMSKQTARPWVSIDLQYKLTCIDQVSKELKAREKKPSSFDLNIKITLLKPYILRSQSDLQEKREQP